MVSEWVLSFNVYGQSGKLVYLNYCSGCHGQEMEGGRALPLIKNNWQYGGDSLSITKIIRNGIPGTEMPKWEGMISVEEIGMITQYIIQAQKSAAKPEEYSNEWKKNY